MRQMGHHPREPGGAHLVDPAEPGSNGPVVNLVALIPARAAARTRPAVALRTG
jgi:hypothetical protein